MAPLQDNFTSFGAGVIAGKIEEFWHERGHLAVRAERFEIKGFPGLYGVRSNLVNGLPPGVTGGRLTPKRKVRR